MGLWSSPLVSINPRPLSALELTFSGMIMGSLVDTVGNNQNPNGIISNYSHEGRADKVSYRYNGCADKWRYQHERIM